MSRAGFEPATPVFERTKTVHALEHAASLFGGRKRYWQRIAVTKKQTTEKQRAQARVHGHRFHLDQNILFDTTDPSYE
jgi:hypothetical protein